MEKNITLNNGKLSISCVSIPMELPKSNKNNVPTATTTTDTENINLMEFCCKSEKDDDSSEAYENESRSDDCSFSNFRSEGEVEVECGDRVSMSMMNGNGDTFMSKLPPTIQILFDGTFFELNMEKTKSCKELVAFCKKCPQNREVRGSSRATSNFRSHLKRNHGEAFIEELDKHIASKRAKMVDYYLDDVKEIHLSHIARMNERLIPPTPTLTPTAAPGTLTPAITGTSGLLTATSIQIEKHNEFEANVLQYFITSFTPLSAVETPEFWAMFNRSDGMIMMLYVTEEQLTKRIETEFKARKEKIIALLESIDFVCTTVDLWSSKYHHYIAINCHWIDARSYERRSVALCCKRLDSCSNVRIAEIFNQIIIDYNLPVEKIISNITDSCYSFSKLFKELQIKINLKTDGVNEVNLSSFQPKEPLTYTCHTRTLSLIATIDVPNAIDSNPALRSVNESALKKVFLFLSLASSNATLSQLLVDYQKPNIVKWNSIYNMILYVLRLEKKYSFERLFELVNIEPFTDAEIHYLKDFLKCTSPIAAAFDRLQCEQGTYYGFVLPSLIEMRKKCEKLQKCDETAAYQPIMKTILAKSNTRFESVFSQGPCSKNAVLATVSHPFFKERWLSAIDGADRDSVRSIFIEAVKEENPDVLDVQQENQHEAPIDDFYFGDEAAKNDGNSKLTVELDAFKYLGDERRDLMMLDEYPVVKRVFLKYNTPLSSSEPVEELFPYATRLNIARYGCLADDLFEERVLLNVNKKVNLSVT